MEKLDPAAFREVLGHLPTGVTVIAAETADGPTGMAVNSVTSVSLDPPLVLFCPAKSSTTWPGLREAGEFCINIMAHHQEEAVRLFAAKGADRFAGIQVEARQAGLGLTEAIAWIECSLYQEHDAGDHTITVARVLSIEASPEAVPLIFFRGRYGSFRGTPDPAEPSAASQQLEATPPEAPAAVALHRLVEVAPDDDRAVLLHPDDAAAEFHPISGAAPDAA
jgi:3-hydroxy-9,10-secoandrosta-1,3,5(10)-triene-9,17-dione monooxygenase reductase component